MVYHVLAIGYMQEEQAILSKQYNKDNIELEFAYSAENAEQLIDSHSYAWTIFHSRTLNCMVYIDIMRKIKDIPILILTSACIECGQEVIQNMLKVGAKNTSDGVFLLCGNEVSTWKILNRKMQSKLGIQLFM